MGNLQLKYKDRTFSSLEEMSDVLLHEVNEQILYIDMGEKRNTKEERNIAKFRLMHLQRAYRNFTPIDYRSMYNSLWSQLYRLEHQDEFKHPYLKEMIMKLQTQRDVR
ncbi:hypothetical protein LC040_08605 [Bacillus tianshenii]|nr:hypothetical protein LC040_08605 [Bacillus tianshenii]